MITAFLCFYTDSLFAQAQNLTGKVTGENEDSLPGVTVLIKGTSNGTATDANGNFSLNAPAAGSTLVVSFIGYITQKINIGNLKSMFSLKAIPRH